MNVPPDTGPIPRRFLFLQGLASPFFAALARELIRRGAAVRKINLSLGDRLFWPLGADDYRRPEAGWGGFVADYLERHAVTDLVLFGDCRPYHRAAIARARERGIAVHVFEEGYLRPNWITLEREGVNGFSLLPRQFTELAPEPEGTGDAVPERLVSGSFLRRALWDVLYNFGNALGRPLYPFYRHHRPVHVGVEYLGWLRKFARQRKAGRDAEAAVSRALSHPGGFFLVPLQLDSDYQIRVHSRFTDTTAFLEEVFASFAVHAPVDALLVVKLHPLDSRLVDRGAEVAAVASRHGLADRVLFIDGGDLFTLVGRARGLVLINSTVGTLALEHGRPTLALGPAVYDLPGLTASGGLDAFWANPLPPDPALYATFRRRLIAAAQVNGGFFSPEGIAMAVRGAADRLAPKPPGTEPPSSASRSPG